MRGTYAARRDSRVRMNRIKELLRNTELTLHQIAERTGFEHSEYLGAAFRREVGLTPGEFRKRHREA